MIWFQFVVHQCLDVFIEMLEDNDDNVDIKGEDDGNTLYSHSRLVFLKGTENILWNIQIKKCKLSQRNHSLYIKVLKLPVFMALIHPTPQFT